MRWFICAVMLFALTPSAFAADFDLDTLRGAESVGVATYPRWSGFYFGGQMSYGNGSASFSSATSGLLAYSLRGLTVEADFDPSAFPILGNANANVTGYGGFVGYNTQWADLVLGLEANYTHSPFSLVAGNSTFFDRIYAIGSSLVSVTTQGTGSMEITDYGSLRARAGWVFDNKFMPYGFAGFAMGRGNYAVTTLVYGQQELAPPPTTPALPCTPSPGSASITPFPTLLRAIPCRFTASRSAAASTWRSRPIFSCAPNTSTSSSRPSRHCGRDQQRPYRRRPQILRPDDRGLVSLSCLRVHMPA